MTSEEIQNQIYETIRLIVREELSKFFGELNAKKDFKIRG